MKQGSENRISVSEAANILGIDPQQLRILMQRNGIDVGFVTKNKTKYTYYIYRDKVLKLLQ